MRVFCLDVLCFSGVYFVFDWILSVYSPPPPLFSLLSPLSLLTLSTYLVFCLFCHPTDSFSLSICLLLCPLQPLHFLYVYFSFFLSAYLFVSIFCSLLTSRTPVFFSLNTVGLSSILHLSEKSYHQQQ